MTSFLLATRKMNTMKNMVAEKIFFKKWVGIAASNQAK